MKPTVCPTCGRVNRRKFDREKAQKMLDEGKSYREIGRACKVTAGAVYFALNGRPAVKPYAKAAAGKKATRPRAAAKE